MSQPSKETGTLADLVAHASQPEKGSDRSFGVVFTVVFIVIAAWPLTGGGSLRIWALVVAAIFLIPTLVAPHVLAPLNRAWMALGLLLGRIVSPIMLLLVYAVAVVPTGLIMRLMGKDPLQRRFQPNARSYWVHRVPPGRGDDSMTRQF